MTAPTKRSRAAKSPVQKYIGDPFEIDAKLIPVGMSYQWMPQDDVERFQNRGWVFVPASDHPGEFMPRGFEGRITLDGMVLMRHLKVHMNAENEKRVAKTHQNVTDWQEKWGNQFSGGARVWSGNEMPPQPTMIGNPEIAQRVLETAPLVAPVASVLENAPSPLPSGPVPNLWKRILSIFLNRRFTP